MEHRKVGPENIVLHLIVRNQINCSKLQLPSCTNNLTLFKQDTHLWIQQQILQIAYATGCEFLIACSCQILACSSLAAFTSGVSSICLGRILGTLSI